MDDVVVTLTLAQRAKVRREELFFNIEPWQARDIEAGASCPPRGYAVHRGWGVLWLLHEEKRRRIEEEYAERHARLDAAIDALRDASNIEA
jgi:hypothetical protein